MISLSHEYCLNELFISPLTIVYLNIDVGGGAEGSGSIGWDVVTEF